MTVPKSDTRIQTDVQAELNRDWRFKPAEVGVEVDDGVVSLTGTVSSFSKLVAAGELAATVPGVKGVANELSVREPDTVFLDDAQIVGALRHALSWNSDVPDERLEVIVRHGAVTLCGQVDFLYQRKAAVALAERTSGVVAVHDQIVVAPPAVSDDDVRKEIRSSLARRLSHAAAAVSVEVINGVVTLRGEVPTFAERTVAANAAAGTAGVKHVANKIKVQ